MTSRFFGVKPMLKSSLVAAAAAAFMFSLNVQAADAYTCTHNGQERKIEVIYKVEGQKVPCEVVYEKASGAQVLWSAQAQEGYCEEKASAFAQKQEGWGWTCTTN